MNKLTIAHFPIIDHLILGVAEHNAPDLAVTTKQYHFWPTLIDDLTTGKVDGAFMLFPLAFDMVQKGADLKLVLLGHREGQVLIARNGIDSPQDLKGKTVFVPEKHSTHHILLHIALKQAGLSIDDITVESRFEKPHDMVEMLGDGKIDALLAAEPMITDALQKGYGHVLQLSHDIDPHHVDCVLVMRQDAIDTQPQVVEDLVRELVKAGLFINAYPRQAAEIGEEFLGWSKKLLVRSLTHDRGHILFWDLLPRPQEFAELQDIAVNEMHLWEKGIDIDSFIDPSFARAAYRDWMIDTRKEVKDRGAERTLPGSFSEAVERMKQFMSADAIGVEYIRSGQKFPKDFERINDVPDDRLSVLEGAHEGVVIQTELNNIKGIALFGPDAGREPDRIILRAHQDDALKILQALQWGDKLHEVKPYDEHSVDRDLFMDVGSVTAIKTNTEVLFSMNFTVFRFVALLLNYF